MRSTETRNAGSDKQKKVKLPLHLFLFLYATVAEAVVAGAANIFRVCSTLLLLPPLPFLLHRMAQPAFFLTPLLHRLSGQIHCAP